MKVRAPSLLKKIMAALSNKTNELRIRLMVFFLLHKAMNKTTLTHSFTNKHQALVPHPTHYHLTKKNDDVFDVKNDRERQILLLQQVDNNGGMVYYNMDEQVNNNGGMVFYNTDDAGYVQEREVGESLTHELFKESEAAMEEEVEEDHGGGSGGGVVVETAEMMEEDIDKAADLFIQRFKREIQLQKLHSLEKNQLQLLHANV